MTLTTTLLAACNEVLLNVGEMEVVDLTSPPARKARLALQKSIRTVGDMHNWSYLLQVVSTTNWVGNVATLVPIQEIYGASLKTTVLASVDADALFDYTASTDFPPGTPEMFAKVGDNRVAVYPEPLADDKPLVLFRVLLQPSTPSLATDSITMPADIYDLVTTFAEYLMHRNHTTDSGSAAECLKEFELRLHMLRTRDTTQQTANIGGYPQ